MDEPAPKRARQACQNCRRKKTRCSGEKPVCSFCLRLGQPCQYSSGTGSARTPAQTVERNASWMQAGPGPGPNTTPDLAARVAFLESRLGVDCPRPLSPVTSGGSVDASHHDAERSNETSKFSVVPPMPVLKALTDVYFTHCHNQPYCYFIETAFRQRLETGVLPDYLLLAFVATAARYCEHEFFENRKEQAMETYARTAWSIVLHQVFSSEQGLNLCAVQAANLLAIVDFIAGQHSLGWVKIGLAVRFAQCLRLNIEPDPSLPPWQQEEYRRVFWSVYMLDRLVSCSRMRSPSILDRDCSVKLPSSEGHPPDKTPTISILHDLPNTERYGDLGDFALTILMLSILGRVVRCSLQQNPSNAFPPWDFRSDFAKIRSILFCLEGLVARGGVPLRGETVRDHRFSDIRARYDRQKAGHYIWSRGLYHLCGCLLHHPFLLHNDLKQHRKTFPRSFARESLLRCQEHAEELTKILAVVRDVDCCARGSFLGYFAVVASSVHRLYEHSSDITLKTQALHSSAVCLEFIELSPQYWNNYGRMAMALREFDVGEPVARALIEPSPSDDDIEPQDMDVLWRILDYGWLSDANRTESPFKPSPSQASGMLSWRFFEDLIGDELNMAVMQQRSSRHGDWWSQLGERDFTGEYV